MTMSNAPRIVVIGATGTIGSAVAALLASDGEVVRVGHTRGDMRLDARAPSDLATFFAGLGPYDHLVSLAGTGAAIGPIETLSHDDFAAGFLNKVAIQIDLVKAGLSTVRDGGSFTVSSGYLNKEPMPGYSAIAMCNGAIASFVKAAALDMPRGVRINAVSPVFVIETLKAFGITDMTPYVTMSAADTALAYRAAVLGNFNGADLDARDFLER
jgi:NAD(P)-dependent dehydrogenase (short-subunit alcohol dehydrogenase family)